MFPCNHKFYNTILVKTDNTVSDIKSKVLKCWNVTKHTDIWALIAIGHLCNRWSTNDTYQWHTILKRRITVITSICWKLWWLKYLVEYSSNLTMVSPKDELTFDIKATYIFEIQYHSVRACFFVFQTSGFSFCEISYKSTRNSNLSNDHTIISVILSPETFIKMCKAILKRGIAFLLTKQPTQFL